MNDIRKLLDGEVKMGELIVFAGLSDVGKTRFTEQMMLEMMQERNAPVVFLDYEVNEVDFTSKLQER